MRVITKESERKIPKLAEKKEKNTRGKLREEKSHELVVDKKKVKFLCLKTKM